MPNKDEIKETLERVVVEIGLVLIGRVSFVGRRCLFERSLFVKKSVWISSHNFLKRRACPKKWHEK